MARAISSQLAAVIADAHVQYDMVRVDLVSGSYGFWMGPAPFTWGGCTYQPGGVIEWPSYADPRGLEAATLTWRLRAVPDAGLDIDVLARIEEETYANRPISWSIAIYNIDHGFEGVLPIWRGQIDYIEHAEEAITRDGQVFTGLAVNATSRSFIHQRACDFLVAPSHFARVAPGDKGLNNLDKAGIEPVTVGRR